MLVGIAGNKYFSTQTLRERMYLTPANLLQFRYGRYSSSYLKRDINAIKDLYESNGFRDVDVKASTQDDYKGTDNDVAVFLTVTEGPQWFVSKLELEGVRKEYVEQIESMLRSIDGQPYSDLNIVNDQETVLNFYFNNGFPAATFESTITPSSDPNRMDVKFAVNEGQRQFVRDVLISGLKITDPDLVRKRMQKSRPRRAAIAEQHDRQPAAPLRSRHLRACRRGAADPRATRITRMFFTALKKVEDTPSPAASARS